MPVPFDVPESAFRPFFTERVAFAATDDPVEFDESGGVRARVRSPVPGTFVWRGRAASVAPGETMRIEMKGERQ